MQFTKVPEAKVIHILNTIAAICINQLKIYKELSTSYTEKFQNFRMTTSILTTDQKKLSLTIFSWRFIVHLFNNLNYGGSKHSNFRSSSKTKRKNKTDVQNLEIEGSPFDYLGVFHLDFFGIVRLL